MRNRGPFAYGCHALPTVGAALFEVWTLLHFVWSGRVMQPVRSSWRLAPRLSSPHVFLLPTAQTQPQGLGFKP